MTSDIELRERLFVHLHRAGSWSYYWVKNSDTDKLTYWHPAGKNGTTPKGANIYFGVHPTGARRQDKQRARAIDVKVVNCVFAEYDAKDFGGDKQACLQHIQELPLPPSVIIDSGGGYHCYWLLDEPFIITSGSDRARIDRVQKAWVAFVGSDDGAKDLARVLRVPGTTNGKYNPPRPVTFCSANFEDLYGLEDLEAISHAPDPEPATTTAAPLRVGNSYAKAALDGELARVRSAQPSTRNTTLNKAAYSLGRLVGAGVLDQGHTESDLISAATAAGLSEREAQRTIKSGMTAGIAKPRQIPQGARQTATAGPDASQVPEEGTPAETQSPALENTDRAKDYGHAWELSRLFKDRFRWWANTIGEGGRNTWMAWNGRVWKDVPENVATKAATDALYDLYTRQLVTLGPRDKEGVRLLTSKIKDTGIYARMEAALRFLKGWEGIVTFSKEWDTDPWLFNVRNGTIDLHTQTLQPHRPADLITKLSPVMFDPSAMGPKFDAQNRLFLPDTDIRRQVQRDLGMALVGASLEESLPIWFGIGSNGKTTEVRAVMEVLGDYASRAAPDLLIKKRADHHPTEIADLAGKRLVFSVEVEEGRALAEALVKDMSGGDRKKARFMGQDFFSFEQTFSIVLVCNNKPKITGTDEGIWRRVRVVPWEYHMPEDQKRPQDEVVRELVAEGPAILNWLLAGLADWQRDPHWQAEKVTAASSAYRQEMDKVAEFREDCCLLGPTLWTSYHDLYLKYTTWCYQNNEEPLSKNVFLDHIKAMKGISEKRVNTARGFNGIGLPVKATDDAR